VGTALIRTLRFYKEKSKDKIILVTDDHPLYRIIIPSVTTRFHHIFQSKKENIAVVNSLENLNKTEARKIVPHHVKRFRTVVVMQLALDVRRFKHNFIRSQSSLNNRTPGEAAHCKPLWGKDKWRTAINIGYVETIKKRLDSFKSQGIDKNNKQTNATSSVTSVNCGLDKYIDLRSS
jgi:hypothetical protein